MKLGWRKLISSDMRYFSTMTSAILRHDEKAEGITTLKENMSKHSTIACSIDLCFANPETANFYET